MDAMNSCAALFADMKVGSIWTMRSHRQIKVKITKVDGLTISYKRLSDPYNRGNVMGAWGFVNSFTHGKKENNWNIARRLCENSK